MTKLYDQILEQYTTCLLRELCFTVIQHTLPTHPDVIMRTSPILESLMFICKKNMNLNLICRDNDVPLHHNEAPIWPKVILPR